MIIKYSPQHSRIRIKASSEKTDSNTFFGQLTIFLCLQKNIARDPPKGVVDEQIFDSSEGLKKVWGPISYRIRFLAWGWFFISHLWAGGQGEGTVGQNHGALYLN